MESEENVRTQEAVTEEEEEFEKKGCTSSPSNALAIGTANETLGGKGPVQLGCQFSRPGGSQNRGSVFFPVEFFRFFQGVTEAMGFTDEQCGDNCDSNNNGSADSQAGWNGDACGGQFAKAT